MHFSISYCTPAHYGSIAIGIYTSENIIKFDEMKRDGYSLKILYRISSWYNIYTGPCIVYVLCTLTRTALELVRAAILMVCPYIPVPIRKISVVGLF